MVAAIKELDAQVLLWLNGWVGAAPPFDGLMRYLASDYLVPVVLSLTLLALWLAGKTPEERDRHQRAAAVAMIALGIASLGVAVINDHVFRPRPFTEHELTLLFYRPTDSSFPANPVAVTAAMAAGVWGGNRRIGALFYALVTLYGFARVYSGVFYPTDVLAGMALGVVTALVCSWGFRLLEPLPTLILRSLRLFHLA